MALSKKQRELIADIDFKVQEILEDSGDEVEILAAMTEQMPEIHELILAASEKELEMYLDEYEGFCYYMKLLETMEQGIKNGVIKIP